MLILNLIVSAANAGPLAGVACIAKCGAIQALCSAGAGPLGNRKKTVLF